MVWPTTYIDFPVFAIEFNIDFRHEIHDELGDLTWQESLFT